MALRIFSWVISWAIGADMGSPCRFLSVLYISCNMKFTKMPLSVASVLRVFMTCFRYNTFILASSFASVTSPIMAVAG